MRFLHAVLLLSVAASAEVIQALIDVYAAALNHASAKHGNAVKPEDVKTLLTTAFINLSKGGAHAA